MKKTSLLTSIFLTGVFAVHGQITVTQADITPIGKVLIQATDTVKSLTPGSINPGPAGANQTWNFSTLLSNLLDTLTFTNPTWVPGGSSFPNSNVAVISTGNGGTSFAENIASGLFIDGAFLDPFGTGPIPITINPHEQIIKFPDTYNNSFQGTSVLDITVAYSAIAGVDSVRLKEVNDKSSLTDGWGSVITPLGTFPCLRHKDRVIKTDSIWAHLLFPPQWIAAGSPTVDTSWHFSWLANNVGFPILEFDSTKADTIRNITWLKVLPYIGAVNENVSSVVISVYPNPTSGLVVIESQKEQVLKTEVYTVFGELVLTENKAGLRVQMDMSGMPNGMYLVKATTSSGTIIKPVSVNK